MVSKHSIAHRLGKDKTEEMRKSISERMRGDKNHNYGKKFSEDIRKKIFESSKGKNISLETRQKMSLAHKGKKYKKKTRVDKLNHKPMLGRVFSDEHRMKISNSVKRTLKNKKLVLEETNENS